MELSELYSSKILGIAARLPESKKLKFYDAKSKKTSTICGSSVEVFIKVKNNKICDYAHNVSACALGQTSCTIVYENIINSNIDELYELRDIMLNMLKNNGKAPSGKWSDLQYLQVVRDFPARHSSTMLVFEAIIDCLDKINSAKK